MNLVTCSCGCVYAATNFAACPDCGVTSAKPAITATKPSRKPKREKSQSPRSKRLSLSQRLTVAGLTSDDAYGDDIYQFIDELWTEQTVYNYTSTARRIPHAERNPNVVFSNHSEVASLDAENRKYALDMLASKQWNRADVREYKRALKGLPQAVEETITLQYKGHSVKDGVLTVSFVAPDDVWNIVGYKAIVQKVSA